MSLDLARGTKVALSQVLEVMELLDGPATGNDVAGLLEASGLEVDVTLVEGDRGSTDFLVTTIPGSDPGAPVLGVVGRLGGIGARPEALGLVSDGDGAVTAVATALVLARMAERGDQLPGDVIVATHICPNAPTEPHDPVPFMGVPVSMEVMNRMEVRPEMDAILSVDTTKGNRILNWRGIAITSTVLGGWVLPVSEDLLDVYQRVTGGLPRVLPITTYDITPYGNGLHHVNSILQPAVATDKPVVGVALTAEVAVPGSGTGASHPTDIAEAVRFCVETAKSYGAGQISFYDVEQYNQARQRYGPLERLQTMGEGATK